MKRLVLIFFVCTISLFGQEQNNTITVTGECTQKVNVDKYVVYVDFREIIGGYQSYESKKIPQLIQEFKDKLRGVKINFENFQENTLYQITSTSYSTSAHYYYITRSIDEVKTILTQKMNGITTWADVLVNKPTNKEIAMLHKKAIDDATDKAEQIARSINKKIGDIKAVEDSNYKQTFYHNTSRPFEPHKYYVKVTFVLK